MKGKMAEKMVSRRSADKSSMLSKEDEDILLDLDSNKKDVNEDASTSESTKFSGTSGASNKSSTRSSGRHSMKIKASNADGNQTEHDTIMSILKSIQNNQKSQNDKLETLSAKVQELESGEGYNYDENEEYD